MSNKVEVEVRAADVEAAIEEGLKKIGLSRSDVIIDVIDEGSRGLLGIGSRDAVVRLVGLSVTRPPRQPKAAPKPKTAVSPRKERKPKERKPAPPKKRVANDVVPDVIEADPEEKTVAFEMLETLLAKMNVTAVLDASVSEPDDMTGQKVHVFDVTGEDLGVLIGPRGETLNAIQYIMRLMVANQIEKRASFVIDVEGYRKRREQALTRLAERMAKKVVSRNRSVSLEPMPPHERRIIHMSLRSSDDVYTQSSGEGPRRKVQILPR
ncbi:RNA-binding protein Jag [hydrothermal vent metagenome]|uniref:RNA-binding protein Jag n=1 Tax=hydrothermal vent metagenome TaxID=652676 RepID=A0A3B0VJZ2_9ZZZZ